MISYNVLKITHKHSQSYAVVMALYFSLPAIKVKLIPLNYVHVSQIAVLIVPSPFFR